MLAMKKSAKANAYILYLCLSMFMVVLIAVER